jgi:hypothetical protein
MMPDATASLRRFLDGGADGGGGGGGGDEDTYAPGDADSRHTR